MRKNSQHRLALHRETILRLGDPALRLVAAARVFPTSVVDGCPSTPASCPRINERAAG